MGRRSVRHQPANQRRGLAPAATAFSTALTARYRRTGLCWIAPVAAVLQRPVRPVHVSYRLNIDARTMGVVRRRPASGLPARERIEPMSLPVVTRLAGRERRDAAPDRDWPRSPGGAVLADTRASATAAVQGAPQRPVAMVLARTAAALAAVPSTQSVSATQAPGGESSTVRRAIGLTQEAGDARPAGLDVRQLTDRVVAALERRAVSARERLRT